MKTRDTNITSFVDRNIDMGFDFIQQTMEDPALLENIPNGTAVVHIPNDDPELAEHNLELAVSVVRKGFDVYIRHVSTNPQSS
jgi:hypothetical protein